VSLSASPPFLSGNTMYTWEQRPSHAKPGQLMERKVANGPCTSQLNMKASAAEVS
jgi:hypothetical protein